MRRLITIPKGWSKGLTAKTDIRVRKRTEKANEANKVRTYRSWNTGLTKDTDPRLKKTSEKLMGHEVSPETCEKIRKANTGHVVSLETREKIRIGNLGRKAWNEGLTKETDVRVKSMPDKLRGKPTWSKGLTKETDPRLMKVSLTNSGKYYGHGRRKEI